MWLFDRAKPVLYGKTDAEKKEYFKALMILKSTDREVFLNQLRLLNDSEIEELARFIDKDNEMLKAIKYITDLIEVLLKNNSQQTTH